ncbi:MAG: DUF924 family protein [Mariprofundaceae bacterium]|nr:DUF924 family protein [Mariprofundaceae bacterium]
MYQVVNHFWFEEIEASYWWKKDIEFDQLLTAKFLDLHQKVRCCELFTWRTSAEGRLAEILVLDQFSRNMFRDRAESFAYDALSLALAQEAISVGADASLSPVQRSFLYMPLMHSESVVIHEQALLLFESLGVEASLDFEKQHKVIIDQFGRYPHRNKILNRLSTPEEVLFLAQPNAGF